MKIITRYIVRHFLAVFSVALFGFVGIYLVIDFFEKFDDIIEKNASWQDALLYFACKTPLIVSQGIPIATLLAALIGLGLLQRNREIIALRAAGLNAWVYAGPVVVTALVLSAATFGLGETAGRPLNRQAVRIWQERIAKTASRMGWTHQNVWYRGDGVLWQARVYDPKRAVFQGATLYFLSEDFRLERRLDARTISWTGRGWQARQGALTEFKDRRASQQSFDVLELHLKERPQDFQAAKALPEELNWLDLYRFARRIEEEGYNATTYVTELHSRLAIACTSLVLAILGLSISLHLGHRGGVALGIALGLLLTFLYLVVLQVGVSMAHAELIHPVVGVWAANVVFALLGGTLWFKAPQ
ncbi:lipopolysaccharide export system permease protein [Desulfacinum hydrothermale DSM 13146]|uniref:Lipopolysaccharide export system permease protein n=1 Tax=Desulfacinum hydrothermale DSM 13146 TaxID=1121390 RepID=A0A1W1X4A7_9BACT|nr:LPS export ABC transporter permease LptG [Desulfacinum hydrothermale]SMC18784.1 lipopolysaccharide export system permease protein [Desulfacinum hydrothermale DSM 13146]